jgi:hypothetical protein
VQHAIINFSSCLPVRNLRRYFLGRSIEASMIGPAERLWPSPAVSHHAGFIGEFALPRETTIFDHDRATRSIATVGGGTTK